MSSDLSSGKFISGNSGMAQGFRDLGAVPPPTDADEWRNWVSNQLLIALRVLFDLREWKRLEELERQGAELFWLKYRGIIKVVLSICGGIALLGAGLAQWGEVLGLPFE